MHLESAKQRLGRAIRFHRERAGLSREKLAESVSVSFETIGNIERGDTWPIWTNLIAICEALKVQDLALFSGNYDPPAPNEREALKVLHAFVKKHSSD